VLEASASKLRIGRNENSVKFIHEMTKENISSTFREAYEMKGSLVALEIVAELALFKPKS
jgi:hypothetical protein